MLFINHARLHINYQTVCKFSFFNSMQVILPQFLYENVLVMNNNF